MLLDLSSTRPVLYYMSSDEVDDDDECTLGVGLCVALCHSLGAPLRIENSVSPRA